MPRVLVIALVVGAISGLIVGGYHNLFTVPVENRAIVLEEQRAAEAPEGMVAEEGGPEVPIWVQARIGLPIGLAILGAIWGLLFTVGFNLLRKAAPNWHPLALSLTVGALGFWSWSLFGFMKFPVNPPGVGDPDTLLFRQFFQTLFIVLSLVGTAALLIAFQRINNLVPMAAQRLRYYGFAVVGYAVYALALFLAIPSNPDPVLVPIDLLELFRTLSMAGHFLHWMLLGAGVGLVIMWKQRNAQSAVSGRMAPGVSTQ